MNYKNFLNDLKDKINNLNVDLKDKNISFLKEDKNFQIKIGKLIVLAVLLIIGISFTNGYLEKEIATVNTKQGQYEEIQTYLKKYHENLTTYNQNLNQIKGKVILEEEIDKANLIISKLAEKNNVKINNIKKTEKKTTSANSNIYSQPTEIIIEGDYPNIIKFVVDIENVEGFFTSVETFNVLNQQAKEPSAITAKIGYKIFYEKKG